MAYCLMTLPADHRKMGILDRYDLISPAELEFIPRGETENIPCKGKQLYFHACKYK